jgi:hypothetical protein
MSVGRVGFVAFEWAVDRNEKKKKNISVTDRVVTSGATVILGCRWDGNGSLGVVVRPLQMFKCCRNIRKY